MMLNSITKASALESINSIQFDILPPLTKYLRIYSRDTLWLQVKNDGSVYILSPDEGTIYATFIAPTLVLDLLCYRY